MPKPNKNRNRQQPDDDDDDEGGGDETFSDTQRTELGNLINAAVSGQLSRKLPSAIKSAVDEGMSSLRELIEQNNGGKRRRDDEGDDEDPDPDDEPPPQRGKRGARARDEGEGGSRRSKDPEVAKLNAKLAKMEQERQAERASIRNRERDALLREELTAAGVEPNRMRGAIAVLRDSLVYDDKAGEWVHRSKVDGVDEDRDVSTGVRDWASTDEGKSYLAQTGGKQQPVQRQGTGTRINGQQQRAAGGGVINRGQQQPNAQQQRAQNRQEAVQNLAQGVNELLGPGISVG
jgi:hypothetical protein